jgi:hypothetical protein
LLGCIEFDKVKNHSLNQSLDSYFTVSLHQGEERRLILDPRFDHVSLSLEKTAEQDVVLVLAGDVHDKLGLAHFGKQLLSGGITFGDERVQLGDGIG